MVTSWKTCFTTDTLWARHAFFSWGRNAWRAKSVCEGGLFGNRRDMFCLCSILNSAGRCTNFFVQLICLWLHFEGNFAEPFKQGKPFRVQTNVTNWKSSVKQTLSHGQQLQLWKVAKRSVNRQIFDDKKYYTFFQISCYFYFSWSGHAWTQQRYFHQLI